MTALQNQSIDELEKQFDNEGFVDLQKFGGLGWSAEDIAIYFGFDDEITNLLVQAFHTKNCVVWRTYERGRLQNQFTIESKLLTDATSGNLNATKELFAVNRDKTFQLSKLDIFGGSADEGALERIQDYISKGSIGDLSIGERNYIDALTLIYSLDGQYGKRKTIQFLTKQPIKLSYEKASKMYSEAVELFYCNRQISRNALRAKTAERFDSLYAAVIATAKTPKDYEIAGNLLLQQAKVLRLDQPDPQVLPAEQYQKQFRLLSLDSETIGLSPANRDILSAQIEELGVSDRVKKRLRSEAGIENVDFIEMMENVTQEED